MDKGIRRHAESTDSRRGLLPTRRKLHRIGVKYFPHFRESGFTIRMKGFTEPVKRILFVSGQCIPKSP